MLSRTRIHTRAPGGRGASLLALAVTLFAAWGCNAPPDDDTPPGLLDGDGDGMSPEAGDCDDADVRVHAGASELCDGRDNDCDGLVDEPYDYDVDGWFTDADVGCLATYPQTDCDDSDGTIHPDAPETCDGEDDDCDGDVDEGLDGDLDGYRVCDDDCDDSSPAVHPGAEEVCDGRDNDCNGLSDENDDGDGDGYGPCIDCDDGDFLSNPGADEVCDTIDNDCDEAVDEGFDGDGDGAASCVDCDDTDPSLFPGNGEECDFIDNDCDGQVDEGFDIDGDTYFSCHEPLDCDDTDPDSFPGNVETCDAADNDCDGTVDEGLAADRDADGYTNCGGDCLDTHAGVHPGGTEVCDGLDNDCASGVPTDERDIDGDGYAVCVPVDACNLALVGDGSSVVWNSLAIDLRADGWAYDDWFNNATELYTEDVDDFWGYGLLVLALDPRSLSEGERSELEDFVAAGGRVLYTGAGALSVADPGVLAGLIRSSTSGPGPSDGLCTIEDGSHPIAAGPVPFAEGSTFTVTQAQHDLATADAASGAVEVVSVGGVSKVIAAQVGDGRLVYWNGNAGIDDWDVGPQASKDLFGNVLAWLADGCRGVRGGDCNDSNAGVYPGSGCP
ncbi:putative metal-binding motif-containing protein [Myxococcota bacterium]|nr:putative metal-binding motif-containing protein [Myxococcota bacterium]